MSGFSCIDWVNFGMQVKAARGFLDLSKEDLGRVAHVAPATITRIESGASDVGFPNAGVALQNYFERNGIEFPRGTFSAQVEFRGETTGIAIAADPSMPAGTRFMWGK